MLLYPTPARTIARHSGACAKLVSPMIEMSWKSRIASARGKYPLNCDSSVARAITSWARSPRTADSVEVSSRKSAINTVKRSDIKDSLGRLAMGGRVAITSPGGAEPGQDRVGVGHGERGVLPIPGREPQSVRPVANRRQPGQPRWISLDPIDLLPGQRPGFDAPACGEEPDPAIRQDQRTRLPTPGRMPTA